MSKQLLVGDMIHCLSHHSKKLVENKLQINIAIFEEKAIETHRCLLKSSTQTQRLATFLSFQTSIPFSLLCGVDFQKLVLSLSLSLSLVLGFGGFLFPRFYVCWGRNL